MTLSFLVVHMPCGAPSATVMTNDAISARGQEKHLVLEGIGGQRPAVAENDRQTLAPVLVVNLRAILGGEDTHGMVSFLLW